MVEAKKRPTIYDVARESGVSYQTVSRVLNNKPKVSPVTRKQVLQAMEKLGYQRNMAAQMLNTQRSQTLLLISVDGKFPIELYAATLAAKEVGYFTFHVECESDALPTVFDMAAARLVDGIYMHAPRLTIDDNKLEQISHGIPLVRRDYAVNSRLTWVGYDQFRASQLIMQHLIDLGHRHFAEVTGTMNFINPMFRHEAFIKTLQASGLEPAMVIHGDYSSHPRGLQSGYEGTRAIIQSGVKFTALLVGNDYMAIGALHALREHNLRVPEDVSLGSFDDADHARYMAPPLTTVEFNFSLQDRLAFQYLFGRITNPDTEHIQHVLMPNLIVRESTAPVF